MSCSRSHEGHHHPQGREHLRQGDRGPALRASGRGRRRGDRPSRTASAASGSARWSSRPKMARRSPSTQMVELPGRGRPDPLQDPRAARGRGCAAAQRDACARCSSTSSGNSFPELLSSPVCGHGWALRVVVRSASSGTGVARGRPSGRPPCRARARRAVLRSTDGVPNGPPRGRRRPRAVPARSERSTPEDRLSPGHPKQSAWTPGLPTRGRTDQAPNIVL